MRTHPCLCLPAFALLAACSGSTGSTGSTGSAPATNAGGSSGATARPADARPVLLRMHPPVGARYRFARDVTSSTDGAPPVPVERDERLLVIEAVERDGTLRVREQWLARTPERPGLESVVVRYARTDRGTYVGEPEVTDPSGAHATWVVEGMRNRAATDVPLPERAVAPGDVWPVSVDYTQTLGGQTTRMAQRGTMRLVAMEGTTAVLESHADLAVLPTTLENGVRMQSRGGGSRTIRMDTRDGFTVESSSRLEQTFQFDSPNGAVQTSTVVTEGHTSVRREP